MNAKALKEKSQLLEIEAKQELLLGVATTSRKWKQQKNVKLECFTAVKVCVCEYQMCILRIECRSSELTFMSIPFNSRYIQDASMCLESKKISHIPFRFTLFIHFALRTVENKVNLSSVVSRFSKLFGSLRTMVKLLNFSILFPFRLEFLMKKLIEFYRFVYHICFIDFVS